MLLLPLISHKQTLSSFKVPISLREAREMNTFASVFHFINDARNIFISLDRVSHKLSLVVKLIIYGF